MTAPVDATTTAAWARLAALHADLAPDLRERTQVLRKHNPDLHAPVSP